MDVSDGFWGYPDGLRRHIHFGDDIYDRWAKDQREFPGLWEDFTRYAWAGFLGPLNNPSSIRTANKDCSISVSFTGKADKSSPNGLGPIKFGPVTVQGLGFTASVTVNKGGVGRLGSDVNLLNMSGAWAINQAAWSTYVFNGEPGGVTRLDDIGMDSVLNLYNGVRDRSSQVDYYDHPGFVDKGVKSFSGNYTFIIRATNGEKSCSLSFRVELSFRQGGGWSFKWGRNF